MARSRGMAALPAQQAAWRKSWQQHRAAARWATLSAACAMFWEKPLF